jgi:predicted dehydrogenase
MKYAIIGCGRISPNHAAAAIENGLEIAAVCDVVKENMDKLCERFKISPKKYVDYKELISENKIDLAAISTESGNHAKIALDLAGAGINFIVEKPVVLSLSEADAIIAKVAEKKIVASVSLQNRFNKSIQKIREALEQNRFGKIFSAAAAIRWNRGKDYYARASWRGTWAQDGGALMNQCVHNIDLMRWLVGEEIDEIFAYTDNKNHPYIEAEDFGAALVKFKNGAIGVIEGSASVFPENLEETLYIFGEKGTVKAGGKSVNVIEEWRFADGLDDADEVKKRFSENPPNVYGFGHTPLYADVIGAIKNSREPYITISDGKKALETVLAIYKSAAEGRPVKFPLPNVATTDFIGRFGGK